MKDQFYLRDDEDDDDLPAHVETETTETLQEEPPERPKS